MTEQSRVAAHPIEVNLGLSFVTFDGRVLESFGATSNATGRVHAATLVQAWVEDAGGKTWLRINTVWQTSPIMIPVAPDRKGLAERLAAEVQGAMAHYQSA